jgi:large subunit ribosomal protein L29
MKENADKARALDTAEIQKQLREHAEQMFRLRFQLRMGQMEGLKKIRFMRKEKARMLTVLRERELNPDAAAKASVEASAKAAAKPKTKAQAKTEAKPKVAAKAKAAPKATKAGGPPPKAGKVKTGAGNMRPRKLASKG